MGHQLYVVNRNFIRGIKTREAVQYHTCRCALPISASRMSSLISANLPGLALEVGCLRVVRIVGHSNLLRYFALILAMTLLPRPVF